MKCLVPFIFEFEVEGEELDLSAEELAIQLIHSDYKEVAFALCDQLAEHCKRVNT